MILVSLCFFHFFFFFCFLVFFSPLLLGHHWATTSIQSIIKNIKFNKVYSQIDLASRIDTNNVERSFSFFVSDAFSKRHSHTNLRTDFVRLIADICFGGKNDERKYILIPRKLNCNYIIYYNERTLTRENQTLRSVSMDRRANKQAVLYHLVFFCRVEHEILIKKYISAI